MCHTMPELVCKSEAVCELGASENTVPCGNPHIKHNLLLLTVIPIASGMKRKSQLRWITVVEKSINDTMVFGMYHIQQ